MKTRMLVIAALLAACSGPSSMQDGGMMPVDAGPSCVQQPMTHVEIINACTSATGIEKNPVLPLLLPDGGLPALQ